MNDFYVGYQAHAPAPLARFVRRVAFGLGTLAAALAALLVLAQQPFAPARFEYGNPRMFGGVVREHPYPSLIADDGRSYLLAAPGKHGAASLVAGMDGNRVLLEAMLIERPEQAMLELVPGTLRARGDATPAPVEKDLGEVLLTGEIVDSKCWTGVMNPGRGKVHRDCAARCVSGGLPPLLVSATRTGSPEVFQLAGSDGRPLGRGLLKFIAEQVSISGRLVERDGALILRAEPKDYVRASASDRASSGAD